MATEYEVEDMDGDMVYVIVSHGMVEIETSALAWSGTPDNARALIASLEKAIKEAERNRANEAILRAASP